MSHDVLIKNETLSILLNVFNVVKNECFGTVSIVIQKVLIYFERRIEIQLKKKTIKRGFFL